MTTASNNIPKKYEKWLRVAILIDYGGTCLCHDVLHKKENLPTGGQKLYKELEPLKRKICRFKDQEDVLCPKNGITDENEFDLTLYANIIYNKFPKKYDSLVADLRNSRNREFHRGNKNLTDKEFDQLWNDTKQMLHNHGFDLQLVVDLKTCALSSSQQFNDITAKIVQGRTDFFVIMYLFGSSKLSFS